MANHNPNTPKPAEPPKPITKAVGIVAKDGGWCLITYTLQGDKVIKTEVSQPNLLAIVLSKAHIALIDSKDAR